MNTTTIMSPLFTLATCSVMPVWLLFIFGQRWASVRRLAMSPWVVAVPAVLYAMVALPNVVALLPAVAVPDHAAVGVLLATPSGTTLAWLHFLAFDLFVGRWVLLDGVARGVPRWLLGISLVLVLLFGPMGLLVHLTTRRAAGAPEKKPSAIAPGVVASGARSIDDVAPSGRA